MELSDTSYQDFFNFKGIIAEASKSINYKTNNHRKSTKFEKQNTEFRKLF